MFYTSGDIMKMDDAYLENGDKYVLTDDEDGWFDFIYGRYEIADALERCLDIDDDGSSILEWSDIVAHELSMALKEDGNPYKAMMLSDNSALQRIFFFNSTND